MAGRITRRLIDDVVDDLDSGRLQRMIRRMRRRAEKAARMAEERARVDAPGLGDPGQDPPIGPNGLPIAEPSDAALGRAVRLQAEVEETIARIRERYQRLDGAAETLLRAIASDHGAAASGGIRVEIVEAQIDGGEGATGQAESPPNAGDAPDPAR